MLHFSFDIREYINRFMDVNKFFAKFGEPLIRKIWGPLPKPIIDPFYEYYQQNKSRFSASFDRTEDYNQNVDPIFYDKSEFRELIGVEGNRLEKEWRSRILFETSPRGNIIMFYDPYKQGFSYYCDSTGIPYNMLNAVAMKYVLMFRCRDFFVDNNVIHYFKESSVDSGENLKKYESPLIPLYFNENSKKPVNYKKTGSPFNKVKSNFKFDSKQILPFNHLVGIKTKVPFSHKIFNLVLNIKKMINRAFQQIRGIFESSSTKLVLQEGKKKDDLKTEEKEYNYNRFIRLGKIGNFRMLQFPPQIFLLNGFKTDLLEGVAAETRLQKQVMSYKDYKRLADSLSTT
jgi:hypothetical protein